MVYRLRNRFVFHLERWIQRGILFQLLLMTALIVGVAVLGGLLAWALTDAFGNPAESVWWAFLRLTDPGYLGDDEGAILRIISTVVTVLGYVLFMGSLIAILTQWLNGTMRRLESGLTPITIRGHVLILGWTNRTPAIVRELVLSEGRVHRFLQRRGARHLRIVILAETVDIALRMELRDLLGTRWDERQVILRSGTSLHIEHLRRVNYAEAAVAILPGADFALGGASQNDLRIVKTLLSIANQSAPSGGGPPVVAEIFDALKIPLAVRGHGGTIYPIGGDALISRLIVQTVRHEGLSHVYNELLSHTHGNEIYVRVWPAFAGRSLDAIDDAFPRAIVLGIVRPEGTHFEPLLNPPPSFVMEAEDRLVMIARSYEDTAPDPAFQGAGAVAGAATPRAAAGASARPQRARVESGRRRLLVLGWSHKIAALVSELNSYEHEHFEVDFLSRVASEERARLLERVSTEAGRIKVRHIQGDYTAEHDLAKMEPARYDNIVVLGSDWLGSEEEADARTIMGYLLLRALIGEGPARPQVLVELMDPENARLFGQRPGEVIISPVILSHLLAHVSLRPELNAIFEELFGPGGAEFFFRTAAELGLAGTKVNIRGLQQHLRPQGEIALGVRLKSDPQRPAQGAARLLLNPPPDQTWVLAPEDEVVVLATYAG